MSLEQVRKLFPESVVNESTSERVGNTHEEAYITLIANDHQQNRRFVSELLTTGALKRICDSISGLPEGTRRPLVLFVGTIAWYLTQQYADLVRDLRLNGCVRIKREVSMQQLQHDILPKSVAILNPFLEEIPSGISVKTYEAVATCMPLVTSLEGFRGLEDCASKMQSAGLLARSTVPGYERFITERLLDPVNASLFRRTSTKIMSTCLEQGSAKKSMRLTQCNTNAVRGA